MPKNRLYLCCAWLTVLCLVVQSVGAAAGGVLCIGCTRLDGGVTMAAAPCTPAHDCCAEQPDGQSLQDMKSGRGGDRGCGCIDVTITPSAGAVMQAPVKIVLAASTFVGPAVVLAAPAQAPLARPLWGDRAGPPICRLLVPAARRTVLVI